MFGLGGWGVGKCVSELGMLGWVDIRLQCGRWDQLQRVLAAWWRWQPAQHSARRCLQAAATCAVQYSNLQPCRLLDQWESADKSPRPIVIPLDACDVFPAAYCNLPPSTFGFKRTPQGCEVRCLPVELLSQLLGREQPSFWRAPQQWAAE